MVLDPRDAILETVVHVQDRRFAGVADAFDQREDELPIHVVEPEARFVEDQQRRVLDHGPGDERQALLAERQPGEWLIGAAVHAEECQPVVGDGLLCVGAPGVEADAVVEAGDDDVLQAGADPVLPLQRRGHVADVLLDLPDALAGAALEAEDVDVVHVALGMIAGDQREQAGLAASVRSADLPVLVGLDRPVEVFEDEVVGVANGCARESNEWCVGVQRRE